MTKHPHPYMDWKDLDVKKGDKIVTESCGEIITCVVTEVVEDEKTGEVRITTE